MTQVEILQIILKHACPSSGPRDGVREYEIDVHCKKITLSALTTSNGFANIQILKIEDN